MNLATTIDKMLAAGMSNDNIVNSLKLYQPTTFVPMLKYVLACGVDPHHLHEIFCSLVDSSEVSDDDGQPNWPEYVPRAKKVYGYDGPVTPRLRENEWLPLRWQVLQRDAFVCAYCGVEGEDNAKWCVDHVIPLSRGGSNELENLVACCQPCNSSKSDRLLSEWKGRFQ